MTFALWLIAGLCIGPYIGRRLHDAEQCQRQSEAERFRAISIEDATALGLSRLQADGVGVDHHGSRPCE